MQILIVNDRPGHSAYLLEICRTWGLGGVDTIDPSAVSNLNPVDAPVLILPAGADPAPALSYAHRGGTLIVFNPRGPLADAAGLEDQGEKPVPLRLRISGLPAAGLAGELLPIVGSARQYKILAGDARALAYLTWPERFDGESVGLTESPLGRGRILAFAFDLARCVILLRQGDPAKAETYPFGDFCARTSHLAVDLGPREASWIPFADLLARFLVDLARRYCPAPVPMFGHLPGGAPGIVLFSSDEDGGAVALTDTEMEEVSAAGGRMNTYIIPINTPTTLQDAQRQMRRHDLSPHPDLRRLDRAPIADRLAEYERQVLLFNEMYATRALSSRNHCVAWAGYTEIIEIQERLGIRMDTDYIAGATYLNCIDSAPYGGFGAAMPMRFARFDGTLINVFQQHDHLGDDLAFHPTVNYSTKLTAEQYESVLKRTLDDIEHRFHTPWAVVYHALNYAKFSRDAGRATMREANRRGMPIWSYDQWCRFWMARDTWRCDDITWDGKTLHLRVHGEPAPEGLCLWLPAGFQGRDLGTVEADGVKVQPLPLTRFGEAVALVPIRAGRPGSL